MDEKGRMETEFSVEIKLPGRLGLITSEEVKVLEQAVDHSKYCWSCECL